MRNRFVLALSLLLVPLGLSAGEKHGKRGHHRDHDGASISIHRDDGPKSCGDVEITFDDEDAVRAEQTLQVPSGGTLQVRLEKRGGASVFGTTGSAYNVALCKAVKAGDEALLSTIRLVQSGNELKVTGPAEGDWAAYLLIAAPRGASLDIEAVNAPISFREVNGTFRATATNGPISVKDSDGSITARTTNGPISFAGSLGEIDLAAVNGPLSVKLAGSEWRGRGLNAKTANGPVSIAMNSNFRSAVQISGSRGPWSCKGEICNEPARMDDDMRTMTVGTGEPLVKISTTNGPVSIKGL